MKNVCLPGDPGYNLFFLLFDSKYLAVCAGSMEQFFLTSGRCLFSLFIRALILSCLWWQ